jgi:signal transduction histidine kinase
MQSAITKPSLPILRFVVSVLLPFGVGLLLFYLLMQPPLEDFGLMTALMGLTTLISALLAYLAYRMAWLQRFSRLRYALMGLYLLAGLLVFFNVWVIAKWMFASQHDLLLATILLVFASGIASTAGFFLSTALTDRIDLLNHAANQIAAGRLETRVVDNGRDEMAQLARGFNSMAARLETANREQREVETLRRDLIAWVGHDLRTPLSSIRAILEALADGLVDDPETVQRYLRTAQQDIRSLSQLIDELFEMSQLDAGGLKVDVTPNSLSDLISDTIESFNELASRQQVTIQGATLPGLDPVNMDTPRIGRVLNNLVGNALRHTPPGGSITLTAERIPGQVVLNVSDTGEGIRPVDLEHIFERFYRAEKSRSRATGGAGLGLAIAKGIVEAHGGTIRVESIPERGSTFIIRLPG